MQNTIPLSRVTSPAKTYDAVFLVGGTGAMFDFDDANIHRIAVELWQANKIVSAVCQ